MEEKLNEVIKQWRATDSQRMIFGVDMPQTQNAIEDLSKSLDALLAEVQSISLVVKDEAMEAVVKEKNAPKSGKPEKTVPVLLPSLPKLFKASKIDSITLQAGVTIEELRLLFQGVSMKTADLEQAGGLKGFLEKNHVAHIKSDQMKFKLLKDGDHVSSEEEEGSGSGGPGDGSGGFSGAKAGKIVKLSKNQEKRLSDFILGDAKKMSLQGSGGDIVGSVLNDPKQLEKVLKRLAKKQKDLRQFLDEVDGRLRELGLEDGAIGTLTKKLSAKKKVMVPEDELRHLREIEKEYKKSLEDQADATLEKIRRINKQLTNERKRSEAILRQLSQGDIVLDKKGKILKINAVAAQILGENDKDIIGKDIKNVLKSHHLLTTVTNWTKESDEFTSNAVEVQAGDEETMSIIRESSVVIENEDGRSIGVLTALQDVTQQEELKRRKNDILDVIGHDLRAPLGAIRQNFDVLVMSADLEKNCDEKQRKFLENCKSNIVRMGKLIEKIMDMRQLETGKITLKCDTVKPAELIDQAVHSLDEWAKNKKITLKVKTGELPDIKGDPERLYQVIMNLVSNALKFTPDEGTIETVGEAVKHQGRDHIRISVKDTGMGIPEADLKRIFDKYEQVTVDTPKGVSGLGLGLSICKTVVELHGGEIWAESKSGKGSVFAFQIPVKQDDET